MFNHKIRQAWEWGKKGFLIRPSEVVFFFNFKYWSFDEINNSYLNAERIFSFNR